MQTRWGSFVEAWANVAIGFVVAWGANAIVLPLFGLPVSGSKSFWIAVVFTVISLVRSYIVRRLFNRIKRFHHVHA
jgi:membrane protein implicated in regulation of membrane protease activity